MNGRKVQRVNGGHAFTWVIGDEATPTTVLKMRCPFCAAHALVKLPPSLLAQQTDATTHVCAPFFGGCNHGFEAGPGLAALEALS